MNIFNNINFERFLSSLEYMWQGMLCIFIVIGVIILSIVIMNAITNRSNKKKNKDQNGN